MAEQEKNTLQEAPWHAMQTNYIAARLQVDAATGLTGEEAVARLTTHGENAIRERPPRPKWLMFLDQFNDFMILILLAAALVSGAVGEPKDAIAIVVIVVLNAVIGFVQEIRAEQALAALKQMTASHALVLRDGERAQISASQIVPGDIVLFEAGNIVPADLRLIETAQLKVDESLLTGEALTVEKHTEKIADETLPLGDQRNMAFKGTIVTYGRGVGIVAATGMHTELGKIASLIEGSNTLKTPLQQRLAVFGRHLGMGVLGICAIVFLVGLMRGEKAIAMFLTAVSLAVAAIPEALPAVITVSLAMGARKMVRQQALIRRLPAVETLGSVTVICSDKTGTLTQNRMTVSALYADGEEWKNLESTPSAQPWKTLLRAMALSNDASSNHHAELTGDPTEIALYLAAAAAGLDKRDLETQSPRIFELPFDSDRKRMTTFHQQNGEVIAYTKGAPETLLLQCTAMLTRAGVESVNYEALMHAAENMAAEGLRVLAVAQRKWSALPAETDDADVIESQLVFLGLVGMIDPPRPEAQEAVALCKTAGIKPVMITGDHALTAAVIARQLGIVDDGEEVLTGAQLAEMEDETFLERVREVCVYARVDPAQKIRIVEALQSHGEFVAMTGDGVNDAPALKRADIGIAMGKGGTDVAREAASLVLMDDNFATIVGAVREGRRIFDNIRKFIKYTMSSNSAEIWTIFLAPFLGMPIPLLPIHILWINLLTDGLPGLALAAEPEEKGVMLRPPRPPKESIFAHGMWQHIIWCGLVIAGVSLFAQAWALRTGSAHWRTMVFTVLTLSQMCLVMAIRSERESLFSQGFLSNRPLIGAVLLTFLLQMATIYVPWLNDIFKTAPLSAMELGVCLLLSPVVFVLVEVEKWMRRKGWIFQNENKAAPMQNASCP